MGSHIDINPILDGMLGRKVPANVTLLGGAGVALGLVGFALGLFVFGSPVWTWGAYLAALVFILGVSQGGVLFSVILTGTEGRWGRSLKRIGEVFGLFLPIGYLALVLFLIGGLKLYPWHHDTMVAGGPVDLAPHTALALDVKAWWLSPGFFILRQLGAFALLIGLDLLYLRGSFGPDLTLAAKHLKAKDPSWQAPGWWSLLGAGATVEAGQRMQNRLFVPIGMTYAFVFSFASFDLIMSLAPWWYANMFGAWFFASSFWIGLAALGITGLLSRDWLGIRHLVTPNVTHDLGKLTLAFTMFWAYTLFAQLLPIWYGNMPEETDFLLIRLTLPEWAWLSRTVGVLCFLMPFTVLVSRGIKKMKWPFISILSVILIGVFLERTMLVMPSVWFEARFPWEMFLLVSVPIWLGFLGGFTLLVSRVLAAVPPVPVSDPFLQPHPWDVHVHAWEGEAAPASK